MLDGSGSLAGALNTSIDGAILFGGSTSGTYVLQDGLVLGGPGAVRVDSGLTAVVGGTVRARSLELIGGRLSGAGRIVGDVVNTAGTVAPGSPFGALSISGSYVQRPAGTLAITLGGSSRCGSLGQLQVDQVAVIAGALSAELHDGCAPATGQRFTVLTGSSLSGSFATVDVPAMLRLDQTPNAIALVGI
jgi:hypothetical protein